MEVKRAVARKTDNRCAMCGKHIQIGDGDFTIDHFIPLNKGGNNSVENLIPMCTECNKKKTDNIYSAYGMLPFLKNKYRKEIINITHKYLNEYLWLSDNNILSFDNEKITLQVPIIIRNSSKQNYYNIPIKLEKVKEVTDEIIEFISKYNEFYGIETHHIPKATKQYVDDNMLYQVRKDIDNKLIAVFFFNKVNMQSTDDAKSTVTILEISNIICDTSHTDIINSTRAVLLRLIVEDIMKSCESIGMEIVDICIQYNTKEKNYKQYRNKVENFVFGNCSDIDDYSTSIGNSDGCFESRLYNIVSDAIAYNQYTEQERNELVHKSRMIFTKQINSKH